MDTSADFFLYQKEIVFSFHQTVQLKKHVAIIIIKLLYRIFNKYIQTPVSSNSNWFKLVLKTKHIKLNITLNSYQQNLKLFKPNSFHSKLIYWTQIQSSITNKPFTIYLKTKVCFCMTMNCKILIFGANSKGW